MNETMAGLYARKSCRQFTDQPITAQTKEQILDAVLQAPSAGNQLLYTIIEVEQQQNKERLAHLCDEQPFIAQAPWALVFLADCRRWYDAYASAGAVPRAPGAGDLLLALADALIAAQNAVVAAQSLGLGSCYIGDVIEHCEEMRELLQLDEYTVPATLLVFGYPTEGQLARPKPPRFARQYIVQQEHYHALTEAELRAMFTARQNEPDFDFDKYIQAFCQRKYAADFSLEMSRSVRRYLIPFLSEREQD